MLQGVDLIEKGRKNTVQWKGDLNASADDHTDAQTAMLRQQISELEVRLPMLLCDALYGF